MRRSSARCVSRLLAFPLVPRGDCHAARNPQGNVVTMTLKQDKQGKVSGTLSGQGLTFTVEAEVRPEGLV